MKNKELNNKGQAQASYISPNAEIVEINVQRVLCGSNEQYSSEDYNPWA